jgi:O-antigen/teichoic acid export membrane protein
LKKDNQSVTVGNKIVFNTLALYIKMIITIVLSFFTIRFLIEALGVEGFGVFTLITGVVSLLHFLNSAMTVSTQRFLSYYQGTGDTFMQEKVFGHSLLLHCLVGLIFVCCLGIAMPFLFGDILNISGLLISEAKLLYLTTILTVLFSILSVPYRATLNAHEHIAVDSIVLIVQSVAKLVSAALLLGVVEKNQLIFLGCALAVSNLGALLFYCLYCKKNYSECKFVSNGIDFNLLKKLAKFAWWNLYSNLCYVLNTHGLNVMFNMFFGTLVNAAYGVAFQVNAQIKNLSQSLLRAISPQIMKSEGMNDRSRTIAMSMIASKFGFFLVSLGSIPCLILMSELLNIWLTEVPKYAVEFCRLFLIATLINQLTIGIAPAVQAIGNIRNFQMIIGTVALLALPVSYFILDMGYASIYAFYVILAVEVVTGLIKIVMFKVICDFSVKEYLLESVIRPIIPMFAALYLCLELKQELNVSSFSTIITVVLVNTVTYSVLFYIICLNKQEKIALNTFAKFFKSKLIN